MPIAADRDLLYVHIPKTGGTSVGHALREAGLSFDFDEVGLWPRLRGHPRGALLLRRLKAVFPINVVNVFADKHLPAAVLRDLVPAQRWQRCFKFAFVRNPWDVVVSTFFYLKAHEDWFSPLEPDYATILARSDFEEFVHYYPMIAADSTAMITGEADELLVDFVGRYERLEEDFAHICERLSLSAPLARMNRSHHAHYREYYDSGTRAIVERHFARDIERFGYSF